jgi:hypothetical protein
MRDKIIAILEGLEVTDDWGGEKLARWKWGQFVFVDGIETAADELMKFLTPAAPDLAIGGDSDSSTPATEIQGGGHTSAPPSK